MTNLPLPITLRQINDIVLPEAFKLLPASMDTPRARLMLLAIAGQESGLNARRQHGNGPARGLWQFERGTAASRGGVWGVALHPASSGRLQMVARARGVDSEPTKIWAALEHDDVLAACVARLLLWTDPLPLPALDDVDGAWTLYAKRTWRPGKPHPTKWPRWHALARETLGV